jgi:hypothetical protein
MKNDDDMDRLRAARPAAPPPAPDHSARFAQMVAEPGDPRVADPTAAEKPRSARRWTAPPRMAAGGSLGLAAIVTGLVLAFGSDAPPAFAITHNADGSLLVHSYHVEAVPAAEQQVNAIMGMQETLGVGINRGPATVPGPITCSTDQAQQVELLLGSDGTDIVPAGVRGAGPWHLVECSISPGKQIDQIGPGNGGSSTGNTGSTGSNTTSTGDTSTDTGYTSTN